MKKNILLYGLAMAFLFALLKLAEYKFIVRDLSLELYIGVVAALFIALGIWVGRQLTKRNVEPGETQVLQTVSAMPFTPNEASIKDLAITKREYEVLELIADGLSNQEIGEKLFVSISTVKTHTSNLFFKLEASRRTQAIQKAREVGLLP